MLILNIIIVIKYHYNENVLVSRVWHIYISRYSYTNIYCATAHIAVICTHAMNILSKRYYT